MCETQRNGTFNHTLLEVSATPLWEVCGGCVVWCGVGVMCVGVMCVMGDVVCVVWCVMCVGVLCVMSVMWCVMGVWCGVVWVWCGVVWCAACGGRAGMRGLRRGARPPLMPARKAGFGSLHHTLFRSKSSPLLFTPLRSRVQIASAVMRLGNPCGDACGGCSQRPRRNVPSRSM